MNKIIYLFGEDHTKSYREIINTEIRRLHEINPFEYLILEELGPYIYLTKEKKEKGLELKRWSVGPMGLKLALELDIPAIGMDTWDKYVYAHDIFDANDYAIDITRSFKLREKKMLTTINKYYPKGNCAVIVGDSHLRTVPTTQLGEISPIYEKFKNNKDAFIIRCPHKEID